MPALDRCDLPTHVGVNNLPKLVTRQRAAQPGIELVTIESEVKHPKHYTIEPSVCVYIFAHDGLG